ncbi:MAG: divalent-cation tolerance protein CutA [Syntrophales bacterium]|nr:divalent-cation tolerance protein CutA [Syntrophales bacterium]MCK9527474.1 divalent-cation tolerance protein CutA [Syntrophales bacterium]MDX9922530.1 divalent cation tolerance protein CutA [Syntrophales bacterium]
MTERAAGDDKRRSKQRNEPEAMLLIKTAAGRYTAVESCIEENHNYDVPEIIKLPVQGGFAPCLAWINEETAGA